MKCTLITIFLLLPFFSIYGQKIIEGTIIDHVSNMSISYVSIGAPNKDLGTVSNKSGYFRLEVPLEKLNDSLKFSCIGYKSELIAIKDLDIDSVIQLEKEDIILQEITISSDKLTKQIILGNNPKGKLRIGFKENKIGFECGVLLPIKQKTRIKELNCNIAECTYDSIFFRVNVYKELGNNMFENILTRPIEINQSISINQKKLHIPLSEYNIVVEDNILITLEYIEDLGKGELFFNAGLFKGAAAYSRKTSHAQWKKSKARLGFYVVADIYNNVL